MDKLHEDRGNNGLRARARRIHQKQIYLNKPDFSRALKRNSVCKYPP